MLKKSTLELGGSDVFVVLDDADLAKAVEGGIFARLGNAGQICTGAKRFIVHRGIADAFTQAFVGAMQGAAMGDPFDANTLLGPLASRDALEGLTKQVDAAIAHGARVLTGGKRPDRTGFFYEPTVLTDVTPDNPAYHQEFFGPVAQLFVVDDDDAIVTLANDSPFGLGGTIFSADIPRARRLASRIETGWSSSTPPPPRAPNSRSAASSAPATAVSWAMSGSRNSSTASWSDEWHRVILQRDWDSLPNLLTGEVTYHNPAQSDPLRGKDALVGTLRLVFGIFEDFEYTRRFGGDDGYGLEFRGRVGDAPFTGIDLIRFDAHGRIADLVVMIRPIGAVVKLGEEAARRMGQAQAGSEG